MDNLRVKVNVTDKSICSYATLNDIEVGHARASYSADAGLISIVSWVVNKEYKRHGFGRMLFASLVNTYIRSFGEPTRIVYIWNMENKYVHDWLVKRFKAKCTCSPILLKIEEKDIWEAHEYELDLDSVLGYTRNISVPFG